MNTTLNPTQNSWINRINWLGVLLTIALLLMVALIGPAQARALTSDHSADVATAWFDMQLELAKTTPGFSPPVAARAFGYSGVALYEAVVPGMPDYQSLVGQLNELDSLPQPEANADYHWPAVANSAMVNITRALFPTTSEENMAAVTDLYDTFAAQFEAEAEADVFQRSVDYGKAVAEAVFAWSMTDSGHESYMTNFPADYQPPVGAGLWLPTPRTNGDPQPAMQPYWGELRPFALVAGDECAITEPPAYAEEEGTDFYAEGLEVYETTTNLTPEQETIALFWSDDPGQTSTPPGHSVSIATQVLRQENAQLDLAAEAYAKIGMAVSDAFIGCWHGKFVHNVLRPVTYIQNMIDAEWMPLLTTPPFPEYPSGHSVQTGAAASVLTALFGEDYAFTDHTHDDRGFAPRSFTSFAEMAEETAISRLYGGIHYRAAIEDGVLQGECIGERINALAFRRAA